MKTSEPLLARVTTFEAACSVAESMAKDQVGRFSDEEAKTFLSSVSLTANGCWFFFANETINIPRTSDNNLVFTAYAVSNTGNHALVYDFRPNFQKMTDYAHMWSLHANGENEDAKRAFAAFIEKYPPSGEA